MSSTQSSIVARYECHEDDIPHTLYRVRYSGSLSLQARARPSFRTRNEFKRTVEDHLDWRKKEHTPFVSLFAERSHAVHWANLRRDDEIYLTEVDGSTLDHVFRVKHLVEARGVRTSLQESMYHDEYLVLRRIPERSIVRETVLYQAYYLVLRRIPERSIVRETVLYRAYSSGDEDSDYESSDNNGVEFFRRRIEWVLWYSDHYSSRTG